MSDDRRRLRIVAITGDGPHHRCLTSLLADKFDLVGLIVEPATSRRKRLWKSKYYNSWFWIVYHEWRRALCGFRAYRAKFFETKTAINALRSVNLVEVPYVNDRRAVDLVRTWKPDLTIICGTSILKADLLNACGPSILNVHGGFLPYYKGNHCFFFALYDDALDRLGSTIHFVNEGIDTGDIVEVFSTQATHGDIPETLYCKCDWGAFQRLMEVLEEYESGKALPRSPQVREGKTYRNKDRTPWRELVFWGRRLLAGQRR